MITGLRIQNFKSWKDTGQIRMGNLTGFFGTNSSGKTAILQMLLLMKQTVESNDLSRVLHTGDEHSYVDVGTFYDVIHKKDISSSLSYSLSWKSKQPISLRSIIPTHVETPSVQLKKMSTEDLRFFAEIKSKKDRVRLSKFNYQIISSHNYIIGMTLKSNGIGTKNGVPYDIFIEGFEYNKLSDLIKIIFEDEAYAKKSLEPIKFYGFPNFIKWDYSGLNLLTNLVNSFEGLLKNSFYLGPLREYPHRIYPWSGERPQDVGRRGEAAIPALLAEPEITKSVAVWLKRLGLIHSFALKPLAKGRKEHEALVRINAGSPEVPITDVGFGLSQILPVLVLCYYVPEGATIIFEQPEIHLHPRVQAGLADLFIEVIKTRKLQIILESHSEHLLRRLQRRVAEQQLDNEQAALYFCSTNQQGESELTGLEMDEFGNISNWPENFFGDELGDLVAMTRAARDRVANGSK